MQNSNVVVAVIGVDEPGVIACVSSVMTSLKCNIEDMSQTTLRGQFTGIFIVRKPDDLTDDVLVDRINSAIQAKKLRVSAVARAYEEPSRPVQTETEPFVISLYGPDRNDIVGTFSRMFSEQRINIDALRAFVADDGVWMQIFEVSIPKDIDTRCLHRVLLQRAESMGLHLTMQHRDIFEAIHRVAIN